VRSFF